MRLYHQYDFILYCQRNLEILSLPISVTENHVLILKFTKIIFNFNLVMLFSEKEYHLIQAYRVNKFHESFIFYEAVQGYAWQSVETELAYHLDLMLKGLYFLSFEIPAVWQALRNVIIIHIM